MNSLRRAFAPFTFLTLIALLFASVAVGALLGPTLLFLTPLYVYLGGGVARFAFAELARGRSPVVPPLADKAGESRVATQPETPRRVSPVVA